MIVRLSLALVITLFVYSCILPKENFFESREWKRESAKLTESADSFHREVTAYLDKSKRERAESNNKPIRQQVGIVSVFACVFTAIIVFDLIPRLATRLRNFRDKKTLKIKKQKFMEAQRNDL